MKKSTFTLAPNKAWIQSCNSEMRNCSEFKHMCALQAVKSIWSELFIQFSYLHRLILFCSRQTTIQAIEAKLKMMEHSSVKDFEINNAPAGSLFGHQRPPVSQPSTRRYQSRGRCDSRPYRRPTNHRRWSISVTFSQTLSSDTRNLCCNSLYGCTWESHCITLWYCLVWLDCCTTVCCQHIESANTFETSMSVLRLLGNTS